MCLFVCRRDVSWNHQKSVFDLWLCAGVIIFAVQLRKIFTSPSMVHCLIAESFFPFSPHTLIPEAAFLRSTLAGSLSLFCSIPVILPWRSTLLNAPAFLRLFLRVRPVRCRRNNEFSGVPDFFLQKPRSGREPFCGYEKKECNLFAQKRETWKQTV